MSQRVDVRPELLRWAVARSGKDLADHADRLPHLEARIPDVRQSMCVVDVNRLYQEGHLWQ
jgi:hypothetical protein